MYDPLKPFIAQDGLEYDDLAAHLLGQPQETQRNRYIQDARQSGTREATIREWVKAYDGEDPRTTAELNLGAHTERKKAADFAIYPTVLKALDSDDFPF